MIADCATPAQQMALDVRLAEEGRPTFRLFRWAEPAISLGRSQPKPAWLNVEKLAAEGIGFVERPTGGALAVHGSDLSCSIVVPREPGVSLDAVCAEVAARVSAGLISIGAYVVWRDRAGTGQRITYCLTQASPYALMVGPRKLCGFAARRMEQSWLIQGSMLLHPVPAAIERAMPPEITEAFHRLAAPLDAVVPRLTTDERVMNALLAAWGGEQPPRAARGQLAGAVE